jgi:hypothetical protein
VWPGSGRVGPAFSGAVASFTDANAKGTAADFAAIIAWGDTTSSIGTVVANGSSCFTINGMHTYAERASYSVSVAITNAGSTASVTSNAAVADATLQAHQLAPPATRFTAFSDIVATFTDADPGGVASDYVATINWGDGTTSSGVVSALGTGFAVSGTHTFAQGRYTITTSITEVGGPSVSATSTISIDLTPPATTAAVDGTLGHDGWWTAFEGPGLLTLTRGQCRDRPHDSDQSPRWSYR